MPLAIDRLAEQVSESARRLGIAQYDVSGSAVEETSVQVEKGDPKQVKASQRSGVTVRVWNEQGQVGVTSTSESDLPGLELALQTALEASQFGIREHAPDFSPEATVPLEPLEIPNYDIEAVPELIAALAEAEQQLLASHPAIAAVPYNGLARRRSEGFYLNSAGALRSEKGSYASLYLYSKTEQADRKPRSAGAFRMAHRLADLDFSGCVTETAEKTISHLDYRPITSGKYLVCFSPEAFLQLLGAFSNLFNAQSVLDRQSLSTPESLGTAIASPLLNLYDDARHPSNGGATAFDGEGTPTRRLPLIEAGVLKNFLHSAGTAKRLGASPTGHANLGAKVTVSPHFGVVEAAEARSELSLDTAESVILIDDLQALHAGVQSLQGSFSLPFDGWLVNQGDRVSIESATAAGDFRELLRNIVQVDAIAQITPGGISPAVWVEGLSITGE
ncbi:putative modulator of DNA gyrase [Synechococcus elongatus PCC 6301]|uniref:Putative modulator of DNA gyrase n=1 Tax=Synechococcus sp. (strain ATCC 27144 / PCC 6301 / SAUG 1402/1) TaxID=269084 RepID=A0A0H3K5L7_SYNP6|nr:TldD/PmbA family protein [Synechococcus elongatus]BAD78454.1 putative modulator of DNA gyrase [Synechococcus elongatus PCC 6301]